MFTSLLTALDSFGRKRSFRSALEAGFRASGLLAHWPLTAATTVNDVVHGYLASTSNTSWSDDGITPASGNVLFPKFSDIVQLDVSKDFTISFWYRMSDHSKQRILITDPSAESQLQVAFWDGSFLVKFCGVIASRGDLEWDFNDGENQTGEFRMVLLTKVGDSVYIYRNAVLLASGTATLTMPDLSLQLGKYSYDDDGPNMYGWVRDVKIYNQGKSLSQVQALYAAGEPGVGPTPNAGLVFKSLLDSNSLTAATGQSLSYFGIESNRLGFETYLSRQCARFSVIDGVGGEISTPGWTTGMPGQKSLSIYFEAAPDAAEELLFMPCAGYGSLIGLYLGVTKYDGYIRTSLFVSQAEDDYTIINGPMVAEDAEWHSFAVTLSVDDTAHATIYIDGAAHIIDIPIFLLEDGIFYIGHHQCSMGNYYYRGALRDVRFFNRTLSGVEIAAIMQE